MVDLVDVYPKYMHQSAWKGYENVRLVPKEGNLLAINACVLASASQMCREMLKQSWESNLEGEMNILTQLTESDLIKVYTFVTSGIIDCHVSIEEALKDESTVSAFSTWCRTPPRW